MRIEKEVSVKRNFSQTAVSLLFYIQQFFDFSKSICNFYYKIVKKEQMFFC